MSSCYSFYYQLKNNNPSDTANALNYFAEVPVIYYPPPDSP